VVDDEDVDVAERLAGSCEQFRRRTRFREIRLLVLRAAELLQLGGHGVRLAGLRAPAGDVVGRPRLGQDGGARLEQPPRDRVADAGPATNSGD
jgi:hypothetical protein